MKNLICCAFAFKEGFATSMQTKAQAGKSATRMYLMNIFVALTSAKMYNPNDDVCLVANCELEAEWEERFAGQSISVVHVPFDSFAVPAKFPWALAFYKLCALKAMVGNGKKYDHILLMDADTYTTRSYEELWQEAEWGVLLYPVNHSFRHPDREVIRRDFERFYPEESKRVNLVHYGGEFVAGTPEALTLYLAYCEKVYERLKEMDYQMQPTAGDETIWSIAAALAEKELPVIPAGAYLYRFWTGGFYLISTVTVSNPVCIWHIPNEKETGFIRLYRYYQKYKKYPDPGKAAAIFGIRKAKRPFNLYTLLNKVSGKRKKLFGNG